MCLKYWLWRHTAWCPDASSETIDNAGESMMTEVNIAEDCVTDDVVVVLLRVDREGVGRYILLNRRSGPLAAGGGGAGESA